MEFAPILKALRNRKRLSAIALIVAILAAAGVKLSSHPGVTGSASTQMIVDSPVSAIADLRQNTAPLATRAAVLAQLLTSSGIQSEIARRVGIPVGDLYSTGPFSSSGQVSQGATGAGAPASNPGGATAQQVYQLSFATQDQQPLITVTAQAPTAADAGRLANAVFPAATAYLASLEQPLGTGRARDAVAPSNRVTLRELGSAQQGVVSSGSTTALAGGVFVALVMISLVIILKLEARSARRSGEQAAGEPDAGDQHAVWSELSKASPLLPEEALALTGSGREGPRSGWASRSQS